MKKIAVVLFVISAALAGCHHKKPANNADTAGSAAAGSGGGSGDAGSGGGGAGSGSAM